MVSEIPRYVSEFDKPVAASPIPDPAKRHEDRSLLTGDIPSPANPPSG